MSPRISRRDFITRAGATVAGAYAFPVTLASIAQQIGLSLRSDTPTQALNADLTRLIPELMKKKEVPGLSISVIRDAQIIWGQGFGVRSTVSKEPVTADTVFEAASLSKPAFAYVVLKLIEDGKLGLDTPLTEYRPDLFMSGEPRLKLITTRMVLSHSSGLPHGRPAGVPVALRFTPGKQFAYSATGIQYLQTVVEHLTGQSLAGLMKEHLLEPFGMRSSSFGWLESYGKAAAQGHTKNGEPGLSGNGQYLRMSPEEREQRTRDFPEYKYPSASAGLYTTADDYARFMIEIIQPSHQNRFRLGAESTAEMLKPQVRINDALSWGLGWGLEHTDAGDSFWHWGDWGVFRNFAMAYKRERTGVVVLTNSFNGPKAYKEIVPGALGGDHPSISWVESYRP